MKIEIAISGMHCAACSARIERVCSRIDGVKSAVVSLNTDSAIIALEAGASSDTVFAAVEQAVTALGFGAKRLGKQSTDSADAPAKDSLTEVAMRWNERQAEQQKDLARRRRELGPALLFAFLLLVVSMGQMLGLQLPNIINPAHKPLNFALVQLFLCLPVLWIGRRFFRQGIPALLKRSPNMDSLVAIGTGSAFLFSLYQTVILLPFKMPVWISTVRHSSEALLSTAAVQDESSIRQLFNFFFGSGHALHGPDLYYESAAVVVALVSLGKFLEARSRLSTSKSLKSLLDLSPETAIRILDNGEQEVVSVSHLAVGDTLLIKPGGRVPVDAEIIDGSAYVDESMLTGESMPVHKETGAALSGGTLVRDSTLTARAARVGSDTVLARIINMVREAQMSKAPVADLADKISYYFVPAVISIAVFAGLFWYFYAGDLSFAVRTFVSVLVVSCPCAMGLATPLSITAATGRGAQLGILFKNGLALENVARIDTLVFDKTGTLTLGRAKLADYCLLASGKAISADSALAVAAALEQSSEHPLARAIVEAAAEKKLVLPPVSDFTSVHGKGVQAYVQQVGVASETSCSSGAIFENKCAYKVFLGNLDFIKEQMELQSDLSAGLSPAAGSADSFMEKVNEACAKGHTPVFLAIGNTLTAMFEIADAIRPESEDIVKKVRQLGLNCLMLTGDNKVTATAIARLAGITRLEASLLPEGKVNIIKKLQADKHIVGMIGDGINDAPALAVADVGLAVNNGIDAAVDSGDVVLMRPGLGALPLALALGKSTMRNIRQNLFWAFAYNIISIPMASGFFFFFGGPALSPMLGGAAMAFSSLAVVANSLRLRFFKGYAK